VRCQQAKWPRLAAVQDIRFLEPATLLPGRIENRNGCCFLETLAG